MDFHALPRRDLQALCKRNGVRANITNAAMADALGALPTVDGVEEYVNRSAPEPEQAGKAAVAEEASVVVEPDDGKEKEEENADAKRETNREEGAPALGVGRRGPSRRARPAPVLDSSTAEPETEAAAPEEKQESPVPRARRVTSKLTEAARPNDIAKEKEDIKEEANNDDAPVQVPGRRGPSRRARPAPVVPASTAEPETKAAAPEEKQESPVPRARRVTSKPTEAARPNDIAEEKEDIKQEANNDDAPVQVVGRRCPSRRVRSASVVPASTAEPETKAAAPEEKQESPVPRARRVTSKPTEAARPNDIAEKEDVKQEANNDDAPVQVMGRRGPSRRARPVAVVASSTAEPETNGAAPEEKQEIPLPRARRVTSKSSEHARPRPNEIVEGEEDIKQETNNDNAPVQIVGRRGPSRRARPASIVATSTAEPETKAAAAPEEKQESPVPRARRVTSKPSEPARPNDIVEENQNIKQKANNDDAPVQVVGRRGPSRRVRPAPVVAASTAEPETKAAAPEEKQESPVPRARRVTSKPTEAARPNDIAEESEDMKQEANNDDVPVQVVGRRGPSRRAWPAPVVDSSTAEPETKAAAPQEKQESPVPRARGVTSKPTEAGRPNDITEEKEDIKQEANNDDAPVQVVGRCGPSRRARPAAIVSKSAAKAATEEELGSPLRRGRRVTVNVKSSAPISTEGGEEDKKEDMQREASKGVAPALGVGRRGASRRARTEAVVSAPSDNVPAEEDAPIPRGRGGKGKAPEPIRLDSDEEEDKEELKLEENEEDAPPAHGVVRRGPSRRAQPAPLEPPATTRRYAADPTKEPDVLVEAILVRPTCVRKPTMKAAAAAEEKVPRRTTKKAAATNYTLQKGKQQELPQEAVPAPVSDEACYDLENVEETADPQNLEQNEVIDEQRQGDEEVVMNEDKILMDETPAEKPSVTDEILIEESLTEELPAIDEVCMGNSAVKKEECKEKSPVEKQQVDVESCDSLLPCLEDSPILGLVSMFAEQTVEKDENEAARFQEGAGPSDVTQFTLIDGKNVDMEKVELATEELPLGSTKLDENGEEDDLQSDFICVDEQKLIADVEKAELATDKLPQSRAKMDEYVEENDFQSNFVHVDEEKLVSDVEKEQLVTSKLAQGTATLDEDVDKQKEITTADSVQDVIMLGDIVVEKVLIVKELQQSTATMDQGDVDDDQLETDFVHDDKEKEVATADKAPKLTVADGEVDREENDNEITQEAPQSIGTMDGCVQEGYFKIDFVHADEPEKVLNTGNVLEISGTEDEVVRKKSGFTGNLPRVDTARDYSDHITSAPPGDVSESLSMIITKPTVSRNEDATMCENSSEKNPPEPVCRNSSEKNNSEPMCKNSSDENTDEPVCKDKSEKSTDEPVGENKSEKNTAEPVTVQENMGLKVARKSADLKHWSLRKLRAKLKETLELEKAKRVALARVDENVCRSNATGQE